MKNLDDLLEKEIEVSLICEILYNVLVFDDGVLTILNNDLIYRSLTQINSIISSNQSLFTEARDLRYKAKLLINYIQPFESFR